jgi:hypothetical protein
VEQPSINGAQLDPLRVFSALGRTFQFLGGHGLLILVLASLLTGLAVVKSTSEERGNSFRSWAISKFSSNLAFGCLGFALAYLLSLGINSNGGTNSQLTLIATPLIPLITGGVVYIESNGTAPNAQPRTSVVAFLLSFVLCYQTFYYQLAHRWPT